MRSNLSSLLCIALLFACSENNLTKDYENTKWSLKLPRLEVSLYINTIDNNKFSGELYQLEPHHTTVSYIEGEFMEKDLFRFSGKDIIFDYDEYFYAEPSVNRKICLGRCKNDTLVIWEENDEKDVSPPFIRDVTFEEKRPDQIALNELFSQTKHLNDEMLRLAPNGLIDFKNLNSKNQEEYATLQRKNISQIYKSLENFKDETFVSQLKNNCFKKLSNIYFSLYSPEDSLWLEKDIQSAVIGKDGYFLRQDNLVRIRSKNCLAENTDDFYEKMINLNLSENDQIQLITALVENDFVKRRLLPDNHKEFVKNKMSDLIKNNSDNPTLQELNQQIIGWKLQKGVLFPNLEFTYLNGKKSKIDKLKGKFILLDCWFTHCGNCIAHQPVLRKISKELEKENFSILSISFENKEILNKFLEKNPLDWPQAMIDMKSFNEIGIWSYPSYYLLNPAGEIVATREELRSNLSTDFIKKFL